MKVLITGASGLIGTAVADRLRRDGDQVVTLVRRETALRTEFRWDPASGSIDDEALDGVDAVVNLSGASIAGRPWTSSYRETLRASRTESTSTLVRAMVEHAGERPRVLVSGSAVGFYGDTGDRVVDETADRGAGFLADVVADWEECARPAADAGIRTGIVLSRAGGTLKLMLPVFKLGAGGRLGSGEQWMSWIALEDEVAAIRWLIDHDELAGPFNLTAPGPATNAEFAKALGKAVNRPTLFTVPGFALHTALHDMADETLLVSQRVLPGRLLESGFGFAHDHLDDALAAALH